jgi:hypothetical protein
MTQEQPKKADRKITVDAFSLEETIFNFCMNIPTASLREIQLEIMVPSAKVNGLPTKVIVVTTPNLDITFKETDCVQGFNNFG